MSLKSKVEAPAKTIAAELFHQFVQKSAADLFQHCVQHFAQKSVDLPEDATAACEDRAALEDELRLYHFASVLLAVLDAEHRDPAFSAVRTELERLFFPASPTDGRAKLVFVRKAMSVLAQLIQSEDEPQPLSWGRRWFQRAAVDETNPVFLDLFAWHWLDHFVAVAKCLREFNPVI